MSNVYKALKRAEREGFWHPETSSEQPPPRTESPDSAAKTGPTITAVAPALPEGEEPTLISREQKGRQLQGSAIREEFIRELKSSRQAFNRERAETPTPTWFNKLWDFFAGQQVESNGDAPAIAIGDEAATRAAEKFQLLRVWLQNWTQADHERVILVSSSLPGEGKSFVSLNLALALASTGAPATLVDADLRKPCLYRSFALAPLNGLDGYLVGRTDFAQSLTPTGLPNLKLVSSQKVAEEATELIAGPRMREFIQRAREMDPTQYILIDAPPVLAAPESEILAEMADAVLFVVAANRTPRALAKKALGLLAHARKLEIVLNRYEAGFTTSRRLGYKYGYGYGYGELEG